MTDTRSTGWQPISTAQVIEAHDNEALILDALNDAYQSGRMPYASFSAAWDVTVARMAALSWHMPADPPEQGK